MVKTFLAVIGVAYFVLAAWCAVSPASTSKSLGYENLSSAAKSEYLVLYGGLQLALGIVFLWPVFRSVDPQPFLLVCLIVHVAIALFRTASYFLYADIPQMTRMLTGVEWAICLATVYVWWKSNPA
jgi:presenilin-like A22 family membrane protease